MAFRDALYRSGVAHAVRARRPVISVGNITVGGTGKTPMVAYLAGLLRGEGLKPAILMRGYRPLGASGMGDEAAALQAALPDVPVFCNRNRAAAAKEAVSSAGANVLLLDDGFQHRRLGRDLDVVTVDALCPFGGGRLLPAGLLRESPSALRRADIVVLTRTDEVEGDVLEEVEGEVRRLAPEAVPARSVHRATRVFFAEENRLGDVAELSGRKVAAFCGIGRPESFRRTLEGLCGEVVLFREFPDHHVYGEEELRSLVREGGKMGAELIVTTEKDYARLRGIQGLGLPPAVIGIELAVTSGEDELRRLVVRAARGGMGEG